MAKVLFILGAGASRAVGVPVMKDFLDRAHELMYTEGVSRDAFDRVFRIVAALQILHAKSHTDLQNIESIFNLFEMSQLVGRLPGVSEEDFKSASSSIRRVLAETIENSCLFPIVDARVTPGEPYRSLVHRLRERHYTKKLPLDWAFVTFNYDIALDFAINWSNLKVDYGLHPKDSDPKSVRLFKLHGSLNWTECECGEIVPLEHIKLPEQTEPGVSVALIALSRLLPTLKHCSDKSVTGLPAIVPPSWNKTQYQRSFGRVWQRAATELAEAENIIVIGYSLPKSDAFFQDLFRLGIAGGTRVKRFVVVDPDEGTEERFHSLLGPELEARFRHRTEGFDVAIEWIKSIEW
jgi:hypothetical protein